MNGGTKIVICETLQSEALAALRLEGLEGAEVITLPPLDTDGNGVHVPYERLTPTDAICLVTGDCLPSGIVLPNEYRFVHALRTTRAYELLTTNVVLDQLLLEGARIVLPGWVANWKNYLKVQDEKLFRKGFQETALKIVMLETGVVDHASELRGFSRFVRLPFEIIPIGLELFSSRLAKGVVMSNFLKEQAKRRALEVLGTSNFGNGRTAPSSLPLAR
ncbi:MAG TPA: hypothetical protein VMS79_01140 [Methanomassiliicoccales archaeon]|nr:hypothetical protein [Methanomassiliicoccales archaeon]